MNDPLATYLQDHLAGASLAIQLLQSMKERHAGKALGEFAANLLEEVQQDRDVLQRFTEEQTGSGSRTIKEFGAWLAEKGSRMKLEAGSGDFEVFETLEFLSLGVKGKLSLWRALEVAMPSQASLAGLDLEQLIARAQRQYTMLEERRLAWAPAALRAPKPE